MRTITSRKGMTLAEIVVSLAVFSVLCTIVVSCMLLITARTAANAANDAMRRDCTRIEEGLQCWLDAFAAESCDPDVSALTFVDDTLIGVLPDGNCITWNTETVRAVSFEIMSSEGNELLFCYVTCASQDGGSEIAFSFCVSSKIGEKRGATVVQTPAA